MGLIKDLFRSIFDKNYNPMVEDGKKYIGLEIEEIPIKNKSLGKFEYLDCCDSHELIVERIIYHESHDSEEICRCKNCSQYWFYRFHEHINFDDDEITRWFTKLEDGEADILLKSKTRPDISYLALRESIQVDYSGIKKVKGQPTYPWM